MNLTSLKSSREFQIFIKSGKSRSSSILYSPPSCRATNSLSIFTTTESKRALAPPKSAFTRPSANATASYSASLFVFWPIALPYDFTRRPSESRITTPIAAGPGFPREPPSVYMVTFSMSFLFITIYQYILSDISRLAQPIVVLPFPENFRGKKRTDIPMNIIGEFAKFDIPDNSAPFVSVSGSANRSARPVLANLHASALGPFCCTALAADLMLIYSENPARLNGKRTSEGFSHAKLLERRHVGRGLKIEFRIKTV